ncbi:SDR family oxidoreductase [Aquibium sp. LZ166]|uniref:SDR family oxidoreductase n=1 Tax=Aquibium pacificus TaxID=3153579 RepID=A0ABV3SL17_9HYPH
MQNAFNLSGQRILITGAGGTLGGATVRACAMLGAEVVLADLDAPEKIASELSAQGRSVSFHALDNTSRSQVDAFVASLGTIDAFADCSGIYSKGDWLADETWDALYERTIDVNVRGPINLMRAVMPAMMKRGHGRIALTTSLAARSAGTTLSVEPAYVASKGALQGLVHYFARQAASSGVVVNAVAPGPIETPMTLASGQPFDFAKLPTGRFGKPAEIGWPMAFLCSPGCTYMTGVVIDINGGLHFS